MSLGDPLPGAVAIDHRGSGYTLGRTADAYAIWDHLAGGAPRRLFPLTVEGWSQAWNAFQALERTAAGPRRGIPRLGIGQIIAGAFSLYRRNLRVLVAIASMVVVPYFGATAALTLATVQVVPQRVGGQVALTPRVPGWVDAVNNGSLYVLVVPILTAAIVTATVWALTGRRPTVRQAYARAGRRARSILWASLLSGAAVTAPLLPGLLLARRAPSISIAAISVVLLAAGVGVAIFLGTRFLLAPPAVVLEGLRGREALRRSWALVRGRTWRVLGTLLVALVILFAVLLVLLAVALAAFLFRDLTEGLVRVVVLLVTAATAVGFTVVGPFVNVVIVLLYLDGRTRVEELTLEAVAASLDGDG